MAIGGLFAFGEKIFKRAGKERRLEDRVDTLETKMCDFDKKLDKIMNNHLPHIQDEISKINNTLTKISTTLEFIISKK